MESELSVEVVDRLYELEKVIHDKIDSIKYGYLEIGRALSEIRDSKLWRLQHRAFDDYLKATYPFSRSWAYGLMKISEMFGDIIEDEAIDIDVTRCFKLLPHTTTENAEELLRMAATTNWRGFEDNIKNLKGERGSDECDHPTWVNVQRCALCGFSKIV